MRAILLWLCLLTASHAAGVVPLEQPVRRSLSPGLYVLIVDDLVFRTEPVLFEVTIRGDRLYLRQPVLFGPIELEGYYTHTGADLQYGGFCECCNTTRFYGELKDNDRLEGEYYVTDDQVVPGHFRLLRLPTRSEP